MANLPPPQRENGYSLCRADKRGNQLFEAQAQALIRLSIIVVHSDSGSQLFPILRGLPEFVGITQEVLPHVSAEEWKEMIKEVRSPAPFSAAFDCANAAGLPNPAG